MSQLALDGLSTQRIVTRAGKPVSGKLATEAKALGRPIKCFACMPNATPPDELIYTPSQYGSGGLLSCRAHLPRD